MMTNTPGLTIFPSPPYSERWSPAANAPRRTAVRRACYMSYTGGKSSIRRMSPEVSLANPPTCRTSIPPIHLSSFRLVHPCHPSEHSPHTLHLFYKKIKERRFRALGVKESSAKGAGKGGERSVMQVNKNRQLMAVEHKREVIILCQRAVDKEGWGVPRWD
ncbi:hypothetical protein NPIL_368241 [Nephila pilipes]|uniref:Uncharacterized protein n=1 Tax=Nephila pilipes TaxID=299642 RepID=A0A8X6QZ51_NEPPI|nr:hypothetical protein NPIL_368241 [Nephila pilipes]